MTIYFKETRDILGIYLKEQGISLQGNSDKKGNIDGIYQMNRKQKSKFKVKFSKYQKNMLPHWEALYNHNRFNTRKIISV